MNNVYTTKYDGVTGQSILPTKLYFLDIYKRPRPEQRVRVSFNANDKPNPNPNPEVHGN